MTEKCKNLISRLHSNDSLWLAAFDWTTNLVAAALDHALALLAAAMAGLLAGHRIGKIYASQVEPLYVEDLRELVGWQVIPHSFARNGAVLGALVGLLLIVILHRKFLAQKVISRIKTGVANLSQTTGAVDAGDARIPGVVACPVENEELTQEKGPQR
ncbi:MAG: hypothetical protein JW741_10220 [Sedimentisphaerales bacterium]|nr:hypothetical protein [Sedimentisphaerales bacterium]